MEGPTSSGGSRNRLTCLNLQEHDDDDDEMKHLSSEADINKEFTYIVLKCAIPVVCSN